MFLTIVLLIVLVNFLYVEYWKRFVKPEFNGKTVLITGASSGIGECLSYRMAESGAKKLILAARREAELERVKKQCQKIKPGIDVQCLVLDLSEPEKCLEITKGINVDILVNNGGLS